MNKILLIALLTSLIATTSVLAQEGVQDAPGAAKGQEAAKIAPAPVPVRTWSVGLFGGYSMDMNGLEQTDLPNVPTCCTGYDSETGSGFVFGGMADFVLSNDVDLIARLGYHTSSVDMTSIETIEVRIRNEAQSAEITHQNSSSFGFVLIEPGLEYHINDLGLIGGLRFGLLTTATYSSKEILDPSIPYDYLDSETGVRNESSGDISETNSTQIGMFVGLRYHLGLNARKTVELVPEIQFAPLFTDVITTDPWSISSLRFMIGISYSFFEKSDANPLLPR